MPKQLQSTNFIEYRLASYLHINIDVNNNYYYKKLEETMSNNTNNNNRTINENINENNMKATIQNNTTVNKKHVNIWLLLSALIGSIIMNIAALPCTIIGLIATVTILVLTIKHRQQYIMWTQLILIIPTWIFKAWFYFLLISNGQF